MDRHNTYAPYPADCWQTPQSRGRPQTSRRLPAIMSGSPPAARGTEFGGKVGPETRLDAGGSCTASLSRKKEHATPAARRRTPPAVPAADP